MGVNHKEKRKQGESGGTRLDWGTAVGFGALMCSESGALVVRDCASRLLRMRPFTFSSPEKTPAPHGEEPRSGVSNHAARALRFVSSVRALILRDALRAPQSLTQKGQPLARRRVNSLRWATRSQATSVVVEPSKSLARRRHLPNHAKVRSTAQRRGSNWKPLTPSGRLTISIVHGPQ